MATAGATRVSAAVAAGCSGVSVERERVNHCLLNAGYRRFPRDAGQLARAILDHADSLRKSTRDALMRQNWHAESLEASSPVVTHPAISPTEEIDLWPQRCGATRCCSVPLDACPGHQLPPRNAREHDLGCDPAKVSPTREPRRNNRSGSAHDGGASRSSSLQA